MGVVGNPWIFAAGLTGNVTSFLVILAPIPTFYRIYKEKSTKDYDSTPYSVALFSSVLWLVYGFYVNDIWLMSVNTFGCIIEGIYLALFIVYAPRRPKIYALVLLGGLNVAIEGTFLLLTLLLARGKKRARIFGWATSAVALISFAAPLSVIRLVIKTKSAKYMPILLSVFLALKAVAWLPYGILKKDMFMTVPTVVGLVFAMIQIGLYMIYGNGEKEKPAEMNKETEKQAMQSSLVDIEEELTVEKP